MFVNKNVTNVQAFADIKEMLETPKTTKMWVVNKEEISDLFKNIVDMIDLMGDYIEDAGMDTVITLKNGSALWFIPRASALEEIGVSAYDAQNGLREPSEAIRDVLEAGKTEDGNYKTILLWALSELKDAYCK